MLSSHTHIFTIYTYRGRDEAQYTFNNFDSMVLFGYRMEMLAAPTHLKYGYDESHPSNSQYSIGICFACEIIWNGASGSQACGYQCDSKLVLPLQQRWRNEGHNNATQPRNLKG
mmetsp:Transcript_21152/g.35848  ORF Transcript_21152/g.35848 Transcript_21152/m.35848 type:complete len:114 (+) Transcript_21152:755-1096(+)